MIVGFKGKIKGLVRKIAVKQLKSYLYRQEIRYDEDKVKVTLQDAIKPFLQVEADLSVNELLFRKMPKSIYGYPIVVRWK